MVQLETLIEDIHRNQAVALAIRNFEVFCPNHPKEGMASEVDMMAHNFSRCALRAMYFAEQFLQNISTIISDINKRADLNGEHLTVIEDKVFFNFDAFIFSAKVLSERTILSKGSHLHEKVRARFEGFKNAALNDFIKKLGTIRNEIVHVNRFGTSIGSIAHVKDNTIIIRCEHELDQNLFTLFVIMNTGLTDFCNTMAKFIMIDRCERYGYPQRDFRFQGSNSSFLISEFLSKIPPLQTP